MMTIENIFRKMVYGQFRGLSWWQIPRGLIWFCLICMLMSSLCWCKFGTFGISDFRICWKPRLYDRYCQMDWLVFRLPKKFQIFKVKDQYQTLWTFGFNAQPDRCKLCGVWVQCKYERVFCMRFACGYIGHKAEEWLDLQSN